MGFSWAHGVTEQPDPSPGVGTHCWGARVLTEAGTLQAGLVPYRQQHQQQLEAAHVPGAVLPKLVEAELVRGRAQRTLTLSDKVLLGDRAPCSAGAATVLHEPRLCSRALPAPLPRLHLQEKKEQARRRGLAFWMK